MIVVNPTGGGLSNGKLAQATATAGDVRSGKKFYAGNDVLKTGTLVPIQYKKGSFIAPSANQSTTISIGFRPSHIMLHWRDDSDNYTVIYNPDVRLDKTAIKEFGSGKYPTVFVEPTSSGFKFTSTGIYDTPGVTYWAFS